MDLVFWFGVATVVILIIFVRAYNKGRAEILTKVSEADALGQQAEDKGERLGRIALERQKAGYVPDPETEHERVLVIDGWIMKLKLESGVDLPESFRTLLTFLTLDELREFVSN